MLYGGLVLLAAGVHAVSLVILWKIPYLIAIVDAAVFHFIFASLGIALWYVVLYNPPEANRRLQWLTNHIASALAFNAIWYFGGTRLTYLILNDPLYLRFAENGGMLRAVQGGMAYALLVCVYYLIIYYRRIQEKVEREAELNRLVRDAQLSALKSQINPHFLFNSLNSIAALTVVKPVEAREMVIALSEFMRYSLRSTEKEFVSLEKELHNIRLYLKIEKVRFGERLMFSINCSDRFIGIPVPNLILQPLVENAIKYGVYDAIEPVEVRLSVAGGDDFMEITLQNEYDLQSISPKGEGVGLANVRERLQVIYGNSNLLQVNKGKTMFEVTVYIPYSAT